MLTSEDQGVCRCRAGEEAQKIPPARLTLTAGPELDYDCRLGRQRVPAMTGRQVSKSTGTWEPREHRRNAE